MYYAIPGKIINLERQQRGDGHIPEKEDFYHATVDIFGVKSTINVHYLDNPMTGDYILVHGGYAIKKISREYFEYLCTFYQDRMEEC